MKLAWVNFLAGVWTLYAGIVPALATGLHFAIVGIFIATVGFLTRKQWQGFVMSLLGVWLLVSGFIPVLIVSGNLIIVGAIVTGLSLWQGLSKE